MTQQSTQGMSTGLSTVLECFTTCEESVGHCLDVGGDQAARTHITALLDCGVACGAMAIAMTRGSALHGRLAQLCAEACDQCAASCERFPDDEVMRRCADICRRCAKECRAMAGAAA